MKLFPSLLILLFALVVAEGKKLSRRLKEDVSITFPVTIPRQEFAVVSATTFGRQTIAPEMILPLPYILFLGISKQA
jgi:hypothetical protein